jgi:hypothetical protein
MELIIESSGGVRCIYDEAFDLHSLGKPVITRASHVEPNSTGRWIADLAPVDGPTLGPFDKRTDALAAEVQWLRDHWLAKAKPVK